MSFSDARVQTNPYQELFASADETCSIARITGTAVPDLMLPGGEFLAGGGPGHGRVAPDPLLSAPLYASADQIV
jgi:hypothetical protein